MTAEMLISSLILASMLLAYIAVLCMAYENHKIIKRIRRKKA